MWFSLKNWKETLQVYLQWEGIYGYDWDIINMLEDGATQDELDDYLTEEGIYGYTSDIWDIFTNNEAYCREMDEDDYQNILNELGLED